jgi:hypothetical protein
MKQKTSIDEIGHVWCNICEYCVTCGDCECKIKTEWKENVI